MAILEIIRMKEARIGVIGLGYVGLPLVIEFCKAGFPVTGFDIDESKVELLNQGKSYIKHIDSSSLTKPWKMASVRLLISACSVKWTAY